MPGKEFYQGFCLALTILNRCHDEPTLCRDAIEQAGLTLKDFWGKGIDEYDMKELRKIMRS